MFSLFRLHRSSKFQVTAVLRAVWTEKARPSFTPNRSMRPEHGTRGRTCVPRSFSCVPRLTGL